MGNHHAGGVTGVGDHNGAGVLVDEGLDLAAIGVVVTLLGAGGDGGNGSAAQVYHGVVVGIERLGDHDLVAVIEDALHDDRQGFAAAGGNEDLILGKGHIEIGVVLLNRVDQLGHTGGGSILQHRLGEIAYSLKEGLRSFHIGLADI